MEAHMLQVANASPAADARTLLDRVRSAACALGSAGLWARMAGQHVVLGTRSDGAFARITPLGDAAYGLAFRSAAGADGTAPRWEPMLLVDELADIVEHALVAIGAQPTQD
jgi:hypothetical protein